jgi:hypothetical protein
MVGVRQWCEQLRCDDSQRTIFPYFTHGKQITIAGYDLYGQDVTKHHVVGNQDAWAAATIAQSDENNQAFTVTIAPDAPSPNQVLMRTVGAQVFLIIRYSLA